jgi:hypothetical protein
MRFLCLYKPSKDECAAPSPEEMAEMGKLIDEMTKAGALLATEGCQPSSTGARVRLSGGRISVTDGPFTETKELVGGFAIIQAKSKEEAIELTKRFLAVAGDGETEIRQLHEQSDFSPEVVSSQQAAREHAWREKVAAP